jgi:4a-hydroxytetrahydrobiopterin dehydratase
MSTLSTERCVACRSDSSRVTEAEIAELRRETSDWQLVVRDGIAKLERVFRFPSFADALAFTNRVGALAEAEGHHPALLTEWGRVTVTWWTHKIRGSIGTTSSWPQKLTGWPLRADTVPNPRWFAPREPKAKSPSSGLRSGQPETRGMDRRAFVAGLGAMLTAPTCPF